MINSKNYEDISSNDSQEFIYNNPDFHIGKISKLEKLKIVIQTLRNPLQVLLNKTSLSSSSEYTTRSGIHFVARQKSKDINEAIVVLSGREYPESFLNVKGSETPIIIDAGGHIGSFSLFVKNINPCAKVYVMEPLSDNLKIIHQNLQLNDHQDVVIINKALSSKTGISFLDTENREFDAVKLSLVKSPSTVDIESINLVDLINQYSLDVVDILKMDIEGSEIDVIRSSQDILNMRVRKIIMEYHEKHWRDEIVERLVNAGSFRLIYETSNILGFQNNQLTK